MERDLSTRIDMAIAYLKQKKVVRYQKDIAKRMGVDENTVSRAKNGGDYNAENFAMKLNAAFGFIFMDDWLINGKGPMTREQKEAMTVVRVPIAPSSTVETNADPVPPWASALIDLVSQNTKTIEGLHRDNEALRQQLADMTKQISALRKAVSAIQYANTNNPTMLTAAENSNNHDD